MPWKPPPSFSPPVESTVQNESATSIAAAASRPMSSTPTSTRSHGGVMNDNINATNNDSTKKHPSESPSPKRIDKLSQGDNVISKDKIRSPFSSPTRGGKRPAAWAPSFVVGADQCGASSSGTERARTSTADVGTFSSPQPIVGNESSGLPQSSIPDRNLNNPSQKQDSLRPSSSALSSARPEVSQLLQHPGQQQLQQYHRHHHHHQDHPQGQSEAKVSSYKSTLAPPQLGGDYRNGIDRNWKTSEESLFVVDRAERGNNDKAVITGDCDPPSTAVGKTADEERRRSLRQNKMQTLIVDQTMLRTRLEWNQLLVNKAFKPYREKICSMDENLPNPQDIVTFEEENDDFYQTDELDDIRGLMLNDPDLTEREIAAFFEGMRLVQVKVNSLQSQLDGLKARQRMTVQRALSRNAAVQGSESAHPYLTRSATMAPMFPGRPDGYSTRCRGSVTAAPIEIVEPLSSDCNVSSQRNATEGKARHGNSISKSLRTMSIARIRTAVDAIDDDLGETNKGNSCDDGVVTTNVMNETETLGDNSNKVEIKRLLAELEEAEKYQKKLEKQLAQAGVVIAEDIPYDVAREIVSAIAERMAEIGGSDVPDSKLKEEYFRLEQEMEKYTTALQLTDEWTEEQAEMERQWEGSIAAANDDAARKVRRHMPVNVRNMSEVTLSSQPTPNGKFLPRSFAKKFKRTNVLQLLRMDPDDIVPMHPSTLENLRVTGLTLTERRALYVHLSTVGPRWKAMQSDKMIERKWNWFNMMKSNFKENVDSWQRHIDQYGPPDSHDCLLIGNQCPVKADKQIDYDGDYGFPEEAVYFKTEIKKSDVDNTSKAKNEAMKLAKEKKESERNDALKKHYKGKILQVSLANGTCDAMDEAMDKMELNQEKWIRERLSKEGRYSKEESAEAAKMEVSTFNDALNELKLSILQFADRSGMQLTGKRDANADQDDSRSMVELALCEEVVESADYFVMGIEERMEQIQIKDGRMKSTIQQLRTLLGELHDRNCTTIDRLSGTEERRQPTRKFRSREVIADEIRKELRAARPNESVEDESPLDSGRARPHIGGMPGRGDLLAELQLKRGRGGRGGGGGDLMAAIAARGQGKNASGVGEGLLAAITARGPVS